MRYSSHPERLLQMAVRVASSWENDAGDCMPGLAHSDFTCAMLRVSTAGTCGLYGS